MTPVDVALVRSLVALLPADTTRELLEALAVYRRWCRDGHRFVGAGLDLLAQVLDREASARQGPSQPVNPPGHVDIGHPETDAEVVGRHTEGGQLAMTFQESAAAMAVSLSTVERLVRDGELPSVRITPAAPRILRTDLEQFLAERRSA